MTFQPEPGSPLIHILLVGPRKITLGKTKIVDGIQQVGLADSIVAANADDPLGESEGSLPVILELKE
jgi:hypothetical protein